MAGRITVVGAGVSGLSCAIRLAERGHLVDVLARDLPGETTSAVMGGLWLPQPAEPADDVGRWARTTLAELTALAADPSTGVRLTEGYLLHASPVPAPDWAAWLDGPVPPQACTDPVPGYAFGYRMTLPLIDPVTYLPYLKGRLVRAGGTLTRLSLAGLPPRGLVVNCTGLSARALVPDPALHPVRVQIVLMSDPGLSSWCHVTGSGERPLSVLPRGREVVVGGTAQAGAWDVTPDPQTAAELVERARTAVPELARARVLGHRVGLRPARTPVRLQLEHRPNAEDPGHAVLHCYGFAGAGPTLSWGCAEDVVGLVARHGTAEPDDARLPP